MKTITKLLSALLSVHSLLGFTWSCHATGTWVALANNAPDLIEHIHLLSDGTVLAAQYEGNGSSWYRLTPDSGGSYVNGTWTNIAAMNDTRLFFSSTVLRDGRLFVAGGEYGSGSATAEIYNPTNNTWTVVSPPTTVLNPAALSPNTSRPQGILDAECKVLPDGRVLLCPVSPKTLNGTLIYDPVANSWTSGPPTLHFVGEATALKLPDGSVLTVDPDSYFSERYLPALNTWTNDATNSPAYLWATLPGFAGETGPAFLLPDGRAIFFGGAGHTALYTPSGGNIPGAWVQGPDIPGGLVAADTSGAMMPNGKILLGVAPPPVDQGGTNVLFPAPTSFYEYDYSVGPTGALTQVTGLTVNSGSYQTMMLDLPDGSVLLGIAGGNQLFEYQPSGSPLAAGKPVISTITTNPDGSYHLTGTLFNGISEGAAYGDDQQMDSNFPLVRFTDTAGHVHYGRTYNWSSNGVRTGSAIVSTDCMPPPGASITDTLQVVANGIASDGVRLLVTTTADSGPGSLRQVAGVLQGGGTVTFAANLSGQTITLTSGEIDLSQDITINASALPKGICINGNGAFRIFGINGGSVLLNSLTLSNAAYSSGGAIYNAGALSLNNCTVANSSSDSGGAIFNYGQLVLSGCTLAGNSANYGGAIYNFFYSSTFVNCTLANNFAYSQGGAIENYGGGTSLLQCTLSANTAEVVGGGIDNYALGTVTVANSIVSGNNVLDIYNWGGSTLFMNGANIVPELVSIGAIYPSGPIFSSDPLLGPLANNGGPTLTMMPQTDSVAIDNGDAGVAAGITYDQRGSGFPRVIGAAVDIGAVEVPINPFVFNTADSGYGSLRYAVTYSTNNSTITFAPALAGQTITLTSGEISLSQSYVIDGSSLSSPMQVNGNHSSRIFDVAGGVSVVLNNLVITNGYTTNGNWGGAIYNGGTLALNNCTFAGNSGDASVAGGAIANQGPLTVTGCTFSGNSAGFSGAIDNRSTCSLQNSTFYGNVAVGGNGGAIDNPFSATLTVLQCTFSGNSAGSVGGGIDNYLSKVNITNSIVSGNTGGDIYNWSGSTIDAGGANIIPVLPNGGTLAGAGTISTANPLLGPLANNGGPTLTMMPQPGSPAIDAGLTSAAAGLAYDQRGPGFPRVVSTAVDIGAVELQIIIANTRSLLTGAARTNGVFGFSFTNLTGASFTVFATTNLALPATAWSNLGPAVEVPTGSGHFHFTDPQATNSAKRFYRVRSP